MEIVGMEGSEERRKEGDRISNVDRIRVRIVCERERERERKRERERATERDRRSVSQAVSEVR